MEQQSPGKISKSGTVPSPQPQAEGLRFSPSLQEDLDALPKSYGRTTIVLMAVDPYRVHAYWEVVPKDLADARRLRGPQARPALRFHEVTGISVDGANAHCCFDVDVQFAAENWYVHLWSPAKSYVVDLGLRTADGSFFALVRSNIAHTPPAGPEPAAESSGARPYARPYEHTPQRGEYSASGTSASSQTTGARFVDLTQMNENSFIPGMSSR